MEEAPSDLVVAWKEAPYSLEKLSAEMRRLWVKVRGQFNQGGARHDGTGIDFTTTDRKVLDADDPQAVLGTQYPVSVQHGEPAMAEVVRHAQRILEADAELPVILSADGHVLDGMHRISRALLDGLATVPAQRLVVDPDPDWLRSDPDR